VKPRTAFLALAISLIALPALAADLPYAGQQARAIKALSDDDIAALRAGEGMGMAKAAELNGYPGPVHVLALAAQLGLTEDQRHDVQAIFDRMSEAAKPLGGELIAQEQALDQLFAKGEITPDLLAAATAAIAELQGRLRLVHMSAHLQTRALLNADQIARYEKLRGYGDQKAPGAASLPWLAPERRGTLSRKLKNMSCCDHDCCESAQTDNRYRRILWAALAVNLTMFGVELVASIIAGSVSLRADALDFLADAANYAVALAVVGLALQWRARAALLKGGVMGLFGLWVAASTIHHALTGTVPHAEVMGAVGLLALAANLAVAGLLYRYRTADSQAMSVWLCTRNDCIANLGVMAAGAGVWMSGTPWPDILVAAVIACLGLSSAAQVIRQARYELRHAPVLFGVPAE
jgi:hypothetical protein